MRTHQWFFCGGWVNCTEENQKILRKLDAEPSLKPIRLVNEIGTIVGHPGKLYFSIHDDNEIYNTKIRLGPLKSDHPVYEIDDKFVPYDVTTSLFRNGKPFVKRKVVEVGTEQWVAEKGRIYEKIDGNLLEINWHQSKPKTKQQKT